VADFTGEREERAEKWARGESKYGKAPVWGLRYG